MIVFWFIVWMVRPDPMPELAVAYYTEAACVHALRAERTPGSVGACIQGAR